MKIRLINADKDLVGSPLPRWYGVAYRRWESRYTVLYVIPLNLIVRYAVGVYWGFYRWVKHGKPNRFEAELSREYVRGRNDGRESATADWIIETAKLMRQQ